MQEIGDNNRNGLMLVGIGASAGGVDALMRLFEQIPEDSGLAFAVVLHTMPERESHLAEVLQTKTQIPVTQVTEAVSVERNHVYCVPPNKGVLLSAGQFRLYEPELTDDTRLAPIDRFFRSLAETYKDKAIAVVLSGADADGSLGLRKIHEEGGVSLVQDPSEAEHTTMPRAAIETGCVDFILPVSLMPQKLVSLRRNAERIQLPSPDIPPRSFEEEALRELLALLRARTRHDFTNYKRSTLLRRVERRLQVTESEDLREYLEHIRQHPEELQGLLRDLLISVTNFFRDPEAFRRLEAEVIPLMFAGKGSGDQIRVWVTGCATGEEAYSLAMLLTEYADRLASPPGLQVFATDIDEAALAIGRNGVYPNTIATDVSADRLKRFFIREGQYYRVKRELREMVLFAPHNILRDPPFSKLNLVSCRNLLIYINRNMQERVLEIFHFALKPDGFLFLGTSESADGFTDLFTPLDKKYRIFRRNENEDRFKAAPAPPPVTGEWEPRSATPPQLPLQAARPEGFSYGELHYRMLEALAPPSVLINGDYDIVHLSEKAGRYLLMSGGEPSRNLLKVAHPDLRLELRSLLISAMQDDVVVTNKLMVNLDGAPRLVRVTVRPLSSGQRGFMLVVFNESDAVEQASADGDGEEAGTVSVQPASSMEPVVRQLEMELERTRDQLRATIEEYETSTEELKASNEELQAMNEELRSASEELETGKEELQSVNEELTTLNAELREKIEEIGRSNSDLQNLMASTRIATIFLDRNLRLKRYTPTAQELFNIIPGDIGRPLGHITHRLDYAVMAEDAEQVLHELHTVEREITSATGRHYMARLLPYRSTDDKISGVVLTFLDITERKSVEEALRASEERLRLVIETAQDYAIMLMDTEGRFTGWNVGAEKMFGYSEEEVLGQPTGLIFTPEDREAGVPVQELRTADREGRATDERWHIRKDGSRFYVSGVLVALREGRGYAKIARDLTVQKQAQDERQAAWQELEEYVQKRTAELAEANSALKDEIECRRRSERQRLELLRRIVTTQEEERRRISRELHDQLGQLLTALRLKLDGLSGEIGNRSELRARIAELAEIVRKLDSDVDFLAWELRPTALDDLGLVVALNNYANEWESHYGIKTNFHSTGLAESRLPPLAESNLYRITQEALHNVAKHAGATSVDLLLERRDNHVVLIIEDNGAGFDAEGVKASGKERGMGIIGMRERAVLVGGTVEIESSPGSGTTIFVRIPLEFAPLAEGE